MRGARGFPISIDNQQRIIPADAGSTENHGLPDCGSQDHSRGCGEHRFDAMRDKAIEGSSPRMRGAPIIICLYCLRLRIIPADAGSTHDINDRSVPERDHPRGCGEH